MEFCLDHRLYESHHCPYVSEGDKRVLSCPLCLKTFRINEDENPNATFERHQKTECDPEGYAKEREARKKDKCPVRLCKNKLTLINSYTCKECRQTVCMSHRLGPDHKCPGKPVGGSNKSGGGFLSAFQNRLSGSNSSKPSGIRSSNSATATSTQNRPQNFSQRSTAVSGSGVNYGGAGVATSVGTEKCPQCSQSFSDVMQLINHVDTAHSSGSTTSVSASSGNYQEKCPHCSSQFVDVEQLINHVTVVHNI
eukprot:CAMPEP_0114993828 /NCGR_PEP_ID=MMETSP0216-20121206/12766_1 /TAXON_ID=223996 /ORGANISM="Protocruzia adherens, Strain Boccale" /LENGTH=251 /DNA_ID=CAMNT_0002357553 /DNA_START=110 /DNA_END=865 /DNA_ORIENTATION=+